MSLLIKMEVPDKGVESMSIFAKKVTLSPSSCVLEIEKQKGKLMKKIFETYRPMVYRRCKNIVQEEEVVKDLMQDVFVKSITK